MKRATLTFFWAILPRLIFQSTPSVKRATIMKVNQIATIIFQSTPSVKRATQYDTLRICFRFYFNPHPLWRGRQNLINETISGDNFNPHPLWRGRPVKTIDIMLYKLFQSTPSVKRATPKIHFSSLKSSYFNPHPLWRGRRAFIDCSIIYSDISIHTLCEEGDCYHD